MSLRLLRILALVLAAAVLGLAFYWDPQPASPVIPEAPTAKGGDFTLDSADGPLSLAALRGKVVLIYFGYTYCPDVCPTALSGAAEALRRLDTTQAAQVSVLFISVDPARDSAAHLKEYVAFFHPAIIGLTGSESEVGAVASRYGAYFARQPAAAGDNYAVDHSADILLVAPDGRLAGHLPHGTVPDRLASEILRLLP